MFQNNSFTNAQISYSSDLSPDFEAIDFDEAGKGDWGSFVYGNQNWGGEGNGTPLRTYIPRDKQRSRYVNTRFIHKNAREKYSIYGVSYTYRGISEKAYRD